MKKNIFKDTILGGLLIAATFLNSCDEIDETERIVAGEVTPFVFIPDTLRLETEGIGFEIVEMHRLLVEDYTGWNCTNCPGMSSFIEHKIEKDYQAIVVGLHPASNLLSSTAPGLPFQLSSTLADTYGDRFGGSAANLSLPALAIDRTRQEGKYLLNGDTTTVQNTAMTMAFNHYRNYNIDHSAAPMIYLGIDIRAKEDTYSIATLAFSPTKVEVPLKLQLWIIENNIRGLQAYKGGMNTSYMHNHVLREAVNGEWGESIVLQPGDDEEGKYLATNTREWSAQGKNFVPENCEVVAFVYNAETYEVLNTVKAKL